MSTALWAAGLKQLLCDCLSQSLAARDGREKKKTQHLGKLDTRQLLL